MRYDLFISYSRRDNEREQVQALAGQIKASFHPFADRELRFFYDVHEIQGMDDWRQKIQSSFRESHLFLAVLSPNYLASPYCRWEWEDYVRYEAMRQCLGEGVAPVFFITLPDAADPLTDRAIARWIDEIYQRQTFDLRPWHDAGEKALQQAHVKETLEKLHASVRERLDRAERARRSPANVLRHNPQFVGRVRELTELRQALVKNKLGVVGARQPGVMATVQGVGGMGKTELALAYAHAFAWDYPGGRWQLRCEHIGDLRVALLQLAGPMKFEFSDEENKSLLLAFERVLRELGRRERCLLVLDNVSEPGLLEPECLDRLPHDGHVDLIATTRLAPVSIPGSAQDQRFIAVDELPEEDALALLRSHQPDGRFPNQAEDDEARAIARLLGGFTLAVETAAIYLGRHPGLNSCQRLRERLEAGSERLPTSEEIAKDPTVAVRHRERLLGKTLAITFETLSPEAIHLLTLASLLPADAIALPWLQAVGANTSRAFHEDPSGPNAVFHQTVDLLLGLRLFQATDVAGADGRLLIGRMHRLVQEYVKGGHSAKSTMSEPALLEHIKARAKFLWDGWVKHEHHWELGPLAACADQWLERDGDGDDGPWLASKVAGPLWKLGNFAEAEALMRRALALWEESLGPNHPHVASALSNLASLLRATNRLAEAEPLFRRALAIIEASYGTDHPGVAGCLNNLAVLLQATNRLTEAEPLFRRALAIDEASYSPDHPDVAIRLNNLAGLLTATNRLTEAEPLFRRVVTIFETSLGSNHPNVATALGGLASLLWATKRLAEAEPISRRHLEIFFQFTRATGREHPHLRKAINNYSGLLAAMGGSPEQIRARLNEIGQPVRIGKDLAGQPRRLPVPTGALTTVASGKMNPPGSPATADERFRRGEECRAGEQWDLAIAHFSAAISLNPKFADAYFKRGNIRLRTGPHDEAIVDYTEAIRLDPKNAKYLNNRGRAVF